MDAIQFPVTFDSTGIKKLPDGSTEYFTQLLSICMLTEPGTHPMSPDFGVNDPSFTAIDGGLFVLNAAQFVPEVTITNIDIAEQHNEGTSRVSVAFEITEE